jgi:hypothetical protein
LPYVSHKTLPRRANKSFAAVLARYACFALASIVFIVRRLSAKYARTFTDTRSEEPVANYLAASAHTRGKIHTDQPING